MRFCSTTPSKGASKAPANEAFILVPLGISGKLKILGSYIGTASWRGSRVFSGVDVRNPTVKSQTATKHPIFPNLWNGFSSTCSWLSSKNLGGLSWWFNESFWWWYAGTWWCLSFGSSLQTQKTIGMNVELLMPLLRLMFLMLFVFFDVINFFLFCFSLLVCYFDCNKLSIIRVWLVIDFVDALSWSKMRLGTVKWTTVTASFFQMLG